ncbi:winged helix-turn-helix domain-containing protein [Edaphobacter sp. HDX4]|uniref:winged helix-turn-helix domain-containing protein n=1 Tax=Edaphobacter sp. HDX4 TaxID=2794064 RepID=UPI002FE6212C
MTQDEYIYEFGQFQLNPTEHLLLCDGKKVSLTAKAFQILVVLVRNCGHLVDKSELLVAVWGDTFVEEGNLAVTISMLRKALGDDRSENRYIETVAKQGYRFLPTVKKIRSVAAPAPNDSRPAEEMEPVYISSSPPTDAPVPNVMTGSAGGRSRSNIWKAAGLIVIAVIGALAFHVQSSVQASKHPVEPIHAIAVLPFEIHGSDASSSHIGMGIADDLISKFGGTDRIVVRPAAAVMKYAGGKLDLSTVADEQKVDALLTGTINSSGGQVSVAAKLVSSRGNTLWSGAYETPITQIGDLEDRIEIQVVRVLYPDRKPLARVKEGLRDPEAYQLYIEGRYFWNKRTADGFRHSIECFQRAVLKDPGYANAYAGLADSYTLLASYGVEAPEEAYPNAKAAALKALQLDDSLTEAHTSLGMVALYYEWDWSKADREFRRAIELNPNYSLAYTWDALYFAATGQPAQAVQQAAKAKEIDPLSLLANRVLGRAFYWNHQYDQAITNYRHAIELDPYWARAHTGLGMALAAQKDYVGAISEFQQANRLSGADAYLDGLIGYCEAMRGNTKAARRILASLTARSHSRYVPAFSVALVSIGLGDRNQAMAWLEKAYQDRSTYMVYAKVDPLLDSVRSDPRFVALITRMGFDGQNGKRESPATILSSNDTTGLVP